MDRYQSFVQVVEEVLGSDDLERKVVEIVGDELVEYIAAVGILEELQEQVAFVIDDCAAIGLGIDTGDLRR